MLNNNLMTEKTEIQIKVTERMTDITKIMN